MHLLELAIQGARGFASSVRLPLKSGYLVLKPGTGAVPPLCGLVPAILFADGRGGDAAFLAPGQKSGKVSIILQGNDQVAYRVMRELGGSGGLWRHDKASASFVAVSQDAAEISQFLRAQAGLPPRTTFEQLFTFSAAQLPSRRPKAAAPATGASEPRPMLASAAPVAAAADISAAQARVAELEREMALAQEVDKIQFRADEVASELFELDSQLKGSEGLKVALAEVEAAHRQAPTPASLGLPEDILQRLERYPRALARRDEALARLDAEQPEDDVLPSRVEPFYRDQRFWAGIAAGLLCLVGGMFLQGVGRYLALVDIPAFGFAAYVALRWVDELKSAEQRTRKGGMRATREKKIHDDFQAEAQPIQAAMRALGVDSPADVADQLGRKGLLLEKVIDFRRQLAELEQSADYAQAATRQKKLKQEQEQLNAQLTEKGAYVRDLREIEREIGRVKESIALARQPARPASKAEAGPAPAGGFEDPGPALMRLASDLFQSDVPTLAGMLKDRSAQYVSALTDRRVVAVEFDKDGNMALQSGGKRTAAGEASARELDLAYLAVRFTLLEKYAARGKMPVLLEDTFGVEEGKLALVARMLKRLGSVGQLIHATGHPAFGQAADTAASV